MRAVYDLVLGRGFAFLTGGVGKASLRTADEG